MGPASPDFGRFWPYGEPAERRHMKLEPGEPLVTSFVPVKTSVGASAGGAPKLLAFYLPALGA